MANLYRIVEAAKVGNDADAEGLDAAVVGYNHLRNGRHTYGVATQGTVHPIFCRCLERGTCRADIDAIDQTDILLLGNLGSQIDELVVVSFVHIWEAWSCGEVLATQRMLGEEVDMVGNNHQIANLEGRIHATGSIRDKECLDAQFVHDAYGEGHFLHVVSLVVVEAALHSHDVYATQFAEDEGTSVTLDGRYGEVRNLTVGDFQLIGYLGS